MSARQKIKLNVSFTGTRVSSTPPLPLEGGVIKVISNSEHFIHEEEEKSSTSFFSFLNSFVAVVVEPVDENEREREKDRERERKRERERERERAATFETSPVVDVIKYFLEEIYISPKLRN